MLALYADVNVPIALIAGLRLRGLEVVTAAERGLYEADDSVLLADALELRRVFLTTDRDFLGLAKIANARQEPYAPIITWPQQKRRIGDLIAGIIPIASTMDFEALVSQVVFL